MVSAIHLGTFTSGKISESTGTDTALEYMEKEEALLKRSQPDDVGDILDEPSPSDRAQSPESSEPKSTDLSRELKSPAELTGGEDKSPDANHAPKPRNRRKSSFNGSSPTRRCASSVGHESKPPNGAKSAQVDAPDTTTSADAAIQEERDG